MEMYGSKPSWRNPWEKLKHKKMIDQRISRRKVAGDPDLAILRKDESRGIAEGIKTKVGQFVRELGE